MFRDLHYLAVLEIRSSFNKYNTRFRGRESSSPCVFRAYFTLSVKGKEKPCHWIGVTIVLPVNGLEGRNESSSSAQVRTTTAPSTTRSNVTPGRFMNLRNGSISLDGI